MAVLDGIADLKSRVASKEDETATGVVPESSPWVEPTPLLLYGCQPATKADLLAALPPRPATDKFVTHYFNALDSAAGKWFTSGALNWRCMTMAH
jgi:hypothetical protein